MVCTDQNDTDLQGQPRIPHDTVTVQKLHLKDPKTLNGDVMRRFM